jgi:hypothetical protein
MPALTLLQRLPLGRVPRTLLLVCGGVAFGLACGRVAVSHYGTASIELLIGVPVLYWVARRPLAAFLFALAVAASVFAYDVLPRAHLPGNPPINLSDMVLGVAVAGTLWRRPWATWPRPVQRYTIALATVLALASISSLRLALLGSSQAHDAAAGYVNLLYLTFCIPVALELSGRLWRPMLGAAVAFAGVISILSIAAAASSSIAHIASSLDPASIFSVSSAPSIGVSAVGSTSRIRLPGLYFVYAMFLPTLVMALGMRDRWRMARILTLLLMLAAIALSLNRNMYVGAVIGLLVMALLGGSRLRYRMLVVVITVAISVTLIVATVVTPSVTSEIAGRAATVLSPSQVVQSNSAQARADEFTHAFATIGQHPWDGVGWLQNYGSYYAGAFRQGVENLYLDQATDFGLPTALAFLLIPGVVLSFGIKRAVRARDPFDRAMVAAGVGSVISLLLSGLVGTYLQDPGTTLVFAAACGIALGAGLRAVPRATGPTPAQPAMT